MTPSTRLTPLRIAAALALGSLGCVLIWVAAPLNNFLLNNSYISDTFLPVAAVVYLLLLLLAINPLLRCLRRHWTLDTRQFALIFAMLLGAAVLPSQGLLRMLPWTLARTTRDINANPALAKAVEAAGIPPSLFPDQLGADLPTPVSEQLLDQLAPGASIPWGSWLPVLFSWGIFLLACWLMMVGMGLILFPHWRERERLPFPLLGVQQQLFEGVGDARAVPTLFRDRLFWLAAGTVMVLYAFNGLNHHLHGQFPPFPLGWNLQPAFTEGMWRYMSREVKYVPHIYFVLVGMAYFMPNRVGFSIWSTILMYGVYRMIGTVYFPPFHAASIEDHRSGAMLAVAASTLFLSRYRWVEVGRAMVTRAADDSGRMLRAAGWMLAAGCLGMALWLLWAGVHPGWVAAFVLTGFIVNLLVARIVAETGLPFIRITGMNPHYFMAMLPVGMLTAASIYMAGFISIIFQYGSRVSATVMTTHAIALDRETSPRQQLRTGYLLILILVVGLMVCGAVHLKMGYSYATSLDGVNAPVVAWGSGRMTHHQDLLLSWTRNAWSAPSYNRFGHLCFGVGLAAALQCACLAIPRWPLHPIGLLLIGHHYGNNAWASVLIGWLIKVTILRLAGAAGYRRARSLFLGLILGEIFSAIIWTLVPVILILLGHDPADVGHIPLLPT